MRFLTDPHRPPLAFRALALAVAAGIAFLLLQAGVAGVRFALLLGKVSSEIAQSAPAQPAPAPKPGLKPLTNETPGIVGVQLLPGEAKKP